jgi:hypothetical protein
MFYFSDSTSLYLYSALLQATAAFAALIAIFVVFKIQMHTGSISIIVNQLLSIYSNSYAEEIRKKIFDNVERKGSSEDILNIVKSDFTGYYLFKLWYEQKSKVETMYIAIVAPLYFSALLMILDTASLLISSHIHRYFTTFEYYWGFFVVFLHIGLWIVLCISTINIITENVSLKKKKP